MSGGVAVERVREAVGVPAASLGLVHGLGSSATIWQRLVERLPETVEVWAFELPWGATEGTNWAVERDTRIWLDRALQLAPRQPDIFVAHSFGANVLLDRIAIRGTADCRGLVLISPFYRSTPAAFDWAAISHYLNDFDDLIRTGILARQGTTAGGTELLLAMVEKVRDRIGPYGWMRFFNLFTWTPFLDLSAVDVPCLVIGGGQDTAAYPQDCRSLAAVLPDATVQILPMSRHFTMIDDPARVAALIRDFLCQLRFPPESATAVKGVAHDHDGHRTEAFRGDGPAPV